MIDPKGRQTDQVRARISSQASFCAHVGAVHLGPSLLQEHNPELPTLSRRKSWLTKANREPVVYNNGRLCTVHEQSDAVNTSVVSLPGDKPRPDSYRMLGHRT